MAPRWLGLALILCLAGAAGMTRADEPATVVKAARWSAKDLSGAPVVLDSLLARGPVFLHFWTTWCPSCQREMALLDDLHEKYRERGFTVVAIAEDAPKTVQKIRPLVRSKKLRMVVVSDPKKEIGDRYNVRQYPTSVLVARDGSIVWLAQGYVPGDEAKLEALVLKQLGE